MINTDWLVIDHQHCECLQKQYDYY